MQRRLTELEQLILLAIMRLDEAYGVTIQCEIEARTGSDVQSGSVYKTLRRLERAGLVTASMGDPTPQRGGRRKRFFELTPRGEATLRAAVEGVAAMATGLGLRNIASR